MSKVKLGAKILQKLADGEGTLSMKIILAPYWLVLWMIGDLAEMLDWNKELENETKENRPGIPRESFDLRPRPGP